MSEGTKELSEQQRRRNRVNLYKRIIVILIIIVILLPTVLCIILFCRMNSMQKDLKDLRTEIAYRKLLENDKNEDKEPTEETPGIAENNPNHNVADSGIHNNDTVNEDGTTLDGSNPGTAPPDETSIPDIGVNESTSTEEPATERQPATEPFETPAPSGQKELVEEALAQGRKVVYLTFDDGPCNNTVNLLDVLDRYGVKATFFINCHPGYEDQLRRMVEEGHTLAMHTYSHEYEHVYRNIDTFGEEISTLQQYIYETTGTMPYIFRFPGGSSNSKAELPISLYIDYLNKNNLIYFDWNVSSGDGSEGLTADQVYNNVINGINKQDVSVVLMHDADYKLSTYEAVSKIIESLQAMNALILPITYDTAPVHHNV